MLDSLVGFFPPSFLSAVLSSCCFHIFQDWTAEDQCPAIPCPWWLLHPRASQAQQWVVPRFLAGLQMTVSNPINLPAWLQIIPENQGTQCCPPTAAIPHPAGCSSCLPVGTGALGRGAAQHGSGASPPPPLSWLQSSETGPFRFIFFLLFCRLLCFGRPVSSGKYYDRVCLPGALFCALCRLLRSRFCLVLKVNGICLSGCREKELLKALWVPV